MSKKEEVEENEIDGLLVDAQISLQFKALTLHVQDVAIYINLTKACGKEVSPGNIESVKSLNEKHGELSEMMAKLNEIMERKCQTPA